MKTALYFTVLLLSVGCCTYAQSANHAQARDDRLEEILSTARDEFNIPALGVIVLSSSGVLDEVVIGVRDIRSNDAATADDYFHLGSNTKAVTGFIAAKLVRDGVLTWDTRIFDLIPELSDMSHEGYASVTLRDLMSHRAWVQPYTTGKEMQAIPVLDGDIAVKRIRFSKYVLREKPKKSSPLSRFKTYAYSNAGYILAAAMLEAASGKSWEQSAQETLVDDLGLSIHLGFPVELGPDQPRGHLPGSYLGDRSNTPVVYDSEYRLNNDDVLNPAGNLSMPMTDYAKFISLHLQGLTGADNYLPAEAYRFLHFGTKQYAIGWENTRRKGVEVSAHTGSKGNFFCHVRIVPEKDLAMIVFSNSGILNASKPIEYFFGGIKLERYLDDIQTLYEQTMF